MSGWLGWRRVAGADPDRPGGRCAGSPTGLGVHPEALRARVGIDRGDRPGTTADEARRIGEPASGVRGPGAGR